VRGWSLCGLVWRDLGEGGRWMKVAVAGHELPVYSIGRGAYTRCGRACAAAMFSICRVSPIALSKTRSSTTSKHNSAASRNAFISRGPTKNMPGDWMEATRLPHKAWKVGQRSSFVC